MSDPVVSSVLQLLAEHCEITLVMLEKVKAITGSYPPRGTASETKAGVVSFATQTEDVRCDEDPVGLGSQRSLDEVVYVHCSSLGGVLSDFTKQRLKGSLVNMNRQNLTLARDMYV